MSEFQKPIDSEEDKTPRGAVRFLAESASAIVPMLKNPGRRRGAAEAIRLAKVQVDAELTRLYAIERTARAFATDYLVNPSRVAPTDDEKQTFEGLKESLSAPVPE